MDNMQYDPFVMNEFIDKLEVHYKNLDGQIDTLNATARNLINVAWEDSEAATAFQGAHTKWVTEFGDTNVKLDALRTAVSQALGNAISADNKIAGAFGAF
ncbi:WXG100 family type VII secretion target [Nocardia otitidiscaviarum]|uniref:WXG100 family type VII secretion target n=1 Tax=Nocardia otitidiscaviarum TaxID=1823 RepID=UPI0018940E0A|nr:WXG100 family type VII secretion target [Nocardia otitidiscaviarum]MBF6179640.1 WXG100 family type VII secretion target [Nocardia otitidiscaviarum]